MSTWTSAFAGMFCWSVMNIFTLPGVFLYRIVIGSVLPLLAVDGSGRQSFGTIGKSTI
jgi:hypothetical protein